MAIRDKLQKLITACPECGQRITLKGSVELERRFSCSHCGAELKVIKIEPLKLGPAYRE